MDSKRQLAAETKQSPEMHALKTSAMQALKKAASAFTEYDFKTTETTQITKLTNEFAKKFDISPDGRWVVYERCKEHDDSALPDIWIQAMDGTGSKMLIKNAASPSWGK